MDQVKPTSRLHRSFNLCSWCSWEAEPEAVSKGVIANQPRKSLQEHFLGSSSKCPQGMQLFLEASN